MTMKLRDLSPGLAREAVAALRAGRMAESTPLGYEHPYGAVLKTYPWRDYRELIAYLRTQTRPETRVAVLLDGVAVASPSARLTALPAESAMWLKVVQPGDGPRFTAALERATDSVVVWNPTSGVQGWLDSFPALIDEVRRLYRPSARFGDLEVWTRKPVDGRDDPSGRGPAG